LYHKKEEGQPLFFREKPPSDSAIFPKTAPEYQNSFCKRICEWIPLFFFFQIIASRAVSVVQLLQMQSQ
jgi:hypothetical protein